MKKLLLKKLYACLPLGMAFIVTAMMFSVSANAQIVYTDIIPDDTTESNVPGTITYNLDLNNDAVNDFRFTETYSSNGFCSINPFIYRRESIAGISSLDTSFFFGRLNTNPVALNYGDSINNNYIWDTSLDTLLYLNYKYTTCSTNITIGNWNSATDHYLPVKFVNNGNNYYGWIKMYIYPYLIGIVQLIFKEYAYNSVANQPLLAGQITATGINENSFASSINLFPNPATNHVTIALGSNNKKVEVTIADITGKIIYTTSAFAAQKIEVNTKDFAAGIYVVQIQTADFIASKKLVIQK